MGAVTALTLVADGLLGLDDDIQPLLRSWSLPPVGDWHPVITLRQILTHSAGLTVHGFPGIPRSERLPSAIEVLEGRSNTPPVIVDIVPGLQSRYSGGGYVLLEVLVEDLTGRPFAELLAERILGPAGMRDSGCEEPSNLAPPLRADGTPLPGGPRWHPFLVGGLWTTPADLVRFAQAVQGQKLLPAALNDEYLSEQLPGWGLGIALLSGGRFGHSGSNAGYRCRLVAAKDGSWAAAVMTGSDAGGKVCIDILNRLGERERWSRWEPLPPPDNPQALAAGMVGEFRDQAGHIWRVHGDTESGLWLTLVPHPALQLDAVSMDRCRLPGMCSELRLVWVDDRVVALELTQDALTTRADRISKSEDRDGRTDFR